MLPLMSPRTLLHTPTSPSLPLRRLHHLLFLPTILSTPITITILTLPQPPRLPFAPLRRPLRIILKQLLPRPIQHFRAIPVETHVVSILHPLEANIALRGEVEHWFGVEG